MSTDNPPAVDREALAEWLYTELEWSGCAGSAWPRLRSQDLHRWRTIAGQLLSSGILHDYDDVYRDAYDTGKMQGESIEVHQLRAAIEALCDRARASNPDPTVTVGIPVDTLRALVADGGDALREVKAQAWNDGSSAMWRYAANLRSWHLAHLPGENPPRQPVNPYRDTAGGGWR